MNRPDIKRLPKRADPLEAQKQLLERVRLRVLPLEKVPLEQALGRVLAQDAVSGINIPAYDKTFIDGYAINADQTSGASPARPVTFRIAGKLFPADYPPSLEVAKGEAVYVACGAPIPRGANATVKVEETRLKSECVEVVREIRAGEGIIPLGDDVKAGAKLLSRGQVLRPQDVGLLASIGAPEAKVIRKPRVAIISGGDELLQQSCREPKKISNNYALVVSGLASELGAQTRLLGIMPDKLEAVTAQIRLALAEADIVVTIGGSSVGVKDFVPDAVNALGEPGVVVQGVLLRPGAISGFGMVDGKPVVMLPGHIGSCIAGFYLFVAPLIGAYSGLGEAGMLPKLSAELAQDLETGPQYRFMLTQLKHVGGKLVAEQVEGGSSALTTIVKSCGYTIVPPHSKLAKGSRIEVTLFGELETAQINASAL